MSRNSYRKTTNVHDHPGVVLFVVLFVVLALVSVFGPKVEKSRPGGVDPTPTKFEVDKVQGTPKKGSVNPTPDVTINPTGGTPRVIPTHTYPVPEKKDTAGGPGRGYSKYNRVKDFGEAWMDVDQNGCKTRDDVLNRDLSAAETVKSGTCARVPVAGLLQDPYTGKEIKFLKGTGKGHDGGVQIDHVVPLKNAWERGAWQWDQKTREEFANDPENLLAVDGASNMEKSDQSPSEWLPSNRGYRCQYVQHFNKILMKYDLPVTKSDRDVETRVCGK